MSDTKLLRLFSCSEYKNKRKENQTAFLNNFGDDLRYFDRILGELQLAWTRVAYERDRTGASHAGLLLPAMILIRHLCVGFEHITVYQTSFAWPAFRPGLEALLFIGKWVDDPAVVKIWKDRKRDAKAYDKLFSGRGLVSRSLPRSQDLRAVLSSVNSEYAHPNATFAYRETALKRVSDEIAQLASPMFETNANLHMAHLFAYLHLSEVILESSSSLLNNALARTPEDKPSTESRRQYLERAVELSRRDSTAKKIMAELGLLEFPATKKKANA